MEMRVSRDATKTERAHPNPHRMGAVRPAATSIAKEPKSEGDGGQHRLGRHAIVGNPADTDRPWPGLDWCRKSRRFVVLGGVASLGQVHDASGSYLRGCRVRHPTRCLACFVSGSGGGCLSIGGFACAAIRIACSSWPSASHSRSQHVQSVRATN